MAFNGVAGSAGHGPSSGGESVLDAGAFFSGVFRTSQNLRIDGEYEGEVYCEGTLTIAESARVSGEINAMTVVVAGQLQGQVDCEGRFELLPSAEAAARVLAGRVVIHPGAVYDGELRMRDEPLGLAPREVTATPLPWRALLPPQETAGDPSTPQGQTANGREPSRSSEPASPRSER